MSIYKGKKTYNKYPYSHNQLSADNPFRYMGSSFNPYLPKVSEYPEKLEYNKDMNKQTVSPYEKKDKPYNRNSSTSLINNSYNIINNNGSYNKKKNFASFRNKKDHVADLFNYPYNPSEKNMNNSPYSVYTTSKLKTPQIQRNQSKNDLNNNNIPIIDNKEFNNNNDLIDNKNNNLFNSQKFPNKYNKNDFNNIKSFFYKENPNRTYRDYMEDKSRVIQNLNGDKNSYLFCLFDGHGGVNVSQFLQENFHKYFKEICPVINPEENFKELFKTLDLKIKDLNLLNMGSTACIIYITKEKGKRVLYSANIGDTRSLLISSNDYKRLSYDHRATDSNEYNRIVKNGGIIFAGRVYGSLMLSRAFGDWELKSYGVISEPYITKININDYDKYLIIATDGIWDVLDDSDVYEMSKNINNSQELCNKIIEKALDKGSMDNISCFVINLN